VGFLKEVEKVVTAYNEQRRISKMTLTDELLEIARRYEQEKGAKDFLAALLRGAVEGVGEDMSLTVQPSEGGLEINPVGDGSSFRISLK
jgi:hypothetical protein